MPRLNHLGSLAVRTDCWRFSRAANGCVFLVLIACQVVAQGASPPNIVMVLLDDMSWVGSSVQMDPNNPDSKSDYHRTPNMEALASQGMVFSHAYAAAPMCSPTRAAMFTGKSPAQLQVTDVRNGAKFDNVHFLSLYRGNPLMPPVPVGGNAGETTIAEAIKQVDPRYGAAFYGKSDWIPTPNLDGYDSYITEQVHTVDTVADPQGMYSITSSATSYMQQQVQANKPFFVTLAHYAVKPGFPSSLPETRAEFDGVPLGTKHRNLDYAAMHLEVDKTLGLVMDKIRSLGIQDNTYVILTSDNGAATGLAEAEIVNAPLYGSKGTIFEGGLRAPLIVTGPGIAAGTYSDVPVTTMDFLPTIYDLAGGTGPLPYGVEGTSFKSVLKNGGQLPTGQTALSRPYGPNGELFFHYPHFGPPIPIGAATPASAVVDGDYKLIRVYGLNGAPDDYMLFNLAQNIEESINPSSPLNLASQMPAKVAELKTKLNNWLEGVNASLPLDVRAPLTLTWKADVNWDPDQQFSVGGEWRSVNDVHSYHHERWAALIDNPNIYPHQVSAESYQPGLSKKSIEFDGNDGIYHQFFQVSDNASTTIDVDNSVTVSTWVRFDNLNSEQLIFEAGANTAGISLTLGDANGDGSKDDLRFRVVGNNVLTVTTEIDKFVDPTRDFVQVTAVLSDKDNDRYVEIYLNGALAGRVNGTAGAAGAVNWDSYFQASLGGLSAERWSQGFNTKADTIGAASGTGSLPFVGGNLRGEIAEFEFRNHAVTGTEVRNHYNTYLDSVDAGVYGLAGQATVPSMRPSNVALNAAQSSALLVIEERSDVLGRAVAVNALVNGPLSLSSANQSTSATLGVGTEFTSYLLHFDPSSNNHSISEAVTGTVKFTEKIIAIVFGQSILPLGDAVFGSLGNYGLAADRGLLLDGSDFLSVSADQYTLNFGLAIPGDDLLQFRVLTERLSFLSADLNADGYVDDDDLSAWRLSYGVDDGGDIDGDGDTDGRDFLVWQRESLLTPQGPQPSADFNRDGATDNMDLDIWQTAFGNNSGGDADGDGVTDGRDFLIWQRQFAIVNTDVSGDGATNGADLAIWQDSFGSNAAGDTDGDGDTDGRDFLNWQRHFGAAQQAISTTVPEPHTLLLGLGVLVALLAARQRVAID